MTEQKRKYYKVGELIWLKEEKITGQVVSLNIPEHEVTVQTVNATETSGDITQKTLKLWQINKLRTNKIVNTRKPLPIKVKYFTTVDETFPELKKIPQGDWIDLRCSEDTFINAGDWKLIPLGVAMQLPFGYEAYIAPRGSTFKNFGILQPNSPGVMDNLYCGDNDQWYMSAYATRNIVIKRGDRICQFRIQRNMPKVEFVTVNTLNNESRSGFGSTGVN